VIASSSVSFKATDSTQIWRKIRGSGHHLTRTQLFSLLVQVQATLSGQIAGSPEAYFLAQTLTNIRAVLARRTLTP
jgi:hypothetical protein